MHILHSRLQSLILNMSGLITTKFRGYGVKSLCHQFDLPTVRGLQNESDCKPHVLHQQQRSDIHAIGIPGWSDVGYCWVQWVTHWRRTKPWHNPVLVQ